jgi:glutamine synthetase
MYSLKDEFASMVFNDNVMRERLPKETYRAFKKTIEEGRDLAPQ